MLFCRWWNSETKKINGIIKKDISPHELRSTCAYLTFNKPFKLILVEYIKDEAQPTTTQYYNIQEAESDEEPSDTESEGEDTEDKFKHIVKREQAKKNTQGKTKPKRI
jgi:hypothetical protein